MIKILELNEYQLRFRCEQDTSLEELCHYFHCSKKKWNQNQIIIKGAPYKKGCTIQIQFMIPDKAPSIQKEIQVLYEDILFVAVYKPPFLLVHDDGNEKDNLQNRVNYYLEQNGWPYDGQAIHRIDYECSGIVLFSKLPFFQPMLDDLIASHACTKEYRALVKGVVPFQNKRISKPIGRNRHNSKAMMISSSGKMAVSHIQVLKRYENNTLCKVLIETGRKHQIRVHLSSLGYPIINDPVYGTIDNDQGLLLENVHMSFLHPLWKEEVDIKLELDARFKSSMK